MRNTYRDLCIAALKTSKCVGLDETPSQDEIALAIGKFNGMAETLWTDSLIAPYDVTLTEQTDPEGSLYFGTTNDPGITPVSVSVPASIEKVVDMGLYRTLNFLNENDFLVQQAKAVGADIPYFTYTFEGPNLVKFLSSKKTKTVNLRFKPLWKAVGLDDIFDLPMHYWGMLEYGLATELAAWFGTTDVGALNSIYLSRKNRIEAMNFEASVLGADRGASTFENGYGL